MSLNNEVQRGASSQSQIDRYREALGALPAPGTGQGLHPKLLGVANLGVVAACSAEDVFTDIRRSVPPGQRAVSDGEIRDAVNKAFAEAARGTDFDPGPAPLFKPELLNALVQAGRGTTEVEIMARSGIPLQSYPPATHFALVLSALYNEDENLFVGDKYDAGAIQPVHKWLSGWTAGQNPGPHIIPNPLSGIMGWTKDGKPSMRADSCVLKHRFAIVEFDDLSREDQLAFWAAVDLPIAALIDSGGKSIHAWIRVDCASAKRWDHDVRGALYQGRLIPLGVDSSCRNPARLSRVPGFQRSETGRWQRLIYLQPNGRRVRV